MMKFIVAFLFSACVVHANAAKGYYWRDYEGTIPLDAFPAGKGIHDDITYIGQTLHRKVGVIVPGKICPVMKKMYFEFDRLEHEETMDVKILCSENHKDFEWVPVRTNDLVEKTYEHGKLVIAGHDRPKPVAIGRKAIGDEIQIGKVLVIDNKFESIHMTNNGLGWQEDGYEVLVYNPKSVRIFKPT